MAHKLLTAPVLRFEGRIRLPLVQHLDRAIVDQLSASMLTSDALRLARTSGTMTATGPLPAVQQFITVDTVGSPNSPESMRNGLRLANAPRLAVTTRGQSAGA